MQPEESKEREMQKLRRETPYPQCVEICDAPKLWGADVCQAVICPQKFVAVLALLLFLPIFGCAGWAFNGINLSEIRDMTGKQKVAAMAGFATTYAVHSLGHLAAYEIFGADWHYDGLAELSDGSLSGSEEEIAGHAGFVAQLAVGYGMKLAGLKGAFVDGYNVGTLAEIALYPVVTPLVCDASDIDETGYAAWAGYALAAGGLFMEKKQ
jgi:hypothetical protein